MPVLVNSTFNVGTAVSKILDENQARQSLLINNKHASQSLRVKFGSSIVSSDVTQVQKISFSAPPSSGSLVLRWNGNNTAGIVSTDAASDVQTKLRAVSGLGSVTVSGDFTVGFSITMTGVTPQVKASDPQVTVFSNTLDATVSLSITTPGAYADGYVVPAGQSLPFTNGAAPIDPVYMVASGADTRVEVLEG